MTLSAKANNKIYYSPEIAEETGKANDWFCISCNEKLIFVRNIAGLKVQHFRHHTESNCDPEPETEEHIALKKWCYENIKADKKYIPDSIMVNGRRPDVLMETNGRKIAIECQCSKISYEDWRIRTEEYSLEGIYVLWLFGNKYFESIEDDEKRISIVEREAHKLYFGRIYCVDYDGDILLYPVHFKPIYRENEDWGGRWLKSKKELDYGKIIKNYNLLLVENGGCKLARFYDKKWWD